MFLVVILRFEIKKYYLTKILLTNYYGIINPQIKYEIIILGCAPKGYIKQLLSTFKKTIMQILQ